MRLRLAAACDRLAESLWDEIDSADRLGNWTPYHLAALRVVSTLDRVSIRLRPPTPFQPPTPVG